MIRVIHLLSSSGLSGAEKIAISIINSSSREIESFYASANGDINNHLDYAGIDHIEINEITPYTILKMFKEYKPDIIHAHDFRSSIKLAFTPCKCKKISHIHQNPPWIEGANFKIFFYFLSSFFYHKIYTVSDKIFDGSIIDKYYHYKIINAPNHIDENEIINLAGDELFHKEYDLLFVGRLCKEKDPMKFIKIAEKIIGDQSHIKAAIVGDGDLRDKCIDYIKNNDLSSNIDVLGYLANPYTIMKSSRILVITSKWEGFGLAAVEALCLGIPVVASPVGGLINIISGENGILCLTEYDYYSSLMSILSDENYYDELSYNAKKSAKAYTVEFDWLNEYKSLIEN